MGRKKKTTEYTPDELELQKKYSHDFLPGSLLGPADASNPFPGKKSVEFRCQCGAVRRLATQDLFHVKHCISCANDAKANRKALKKQAK